MLRQTFGTPSSVIYPDFQRLILTITFFRLAVFFHISSSCRIRSSVTLLLLTDSSSEYISSSFFSSLTGCSGSSAISDVSSSSSSRLCSGLTFIICCCIKSVSLFRGPHPVRWCEPSILPIRALSIHPVLTRSVHIPAA